MIHMDVVTTSRPQRIAMLHRHYIQHAIQHNVYKVFDNQTNLCFSNSKSEMRALNARTSVRSCSSVLLLEDDVSDFNSAFN